MFITIMYVCVDVYVCVYKVDQSVHQIHVFLHVYKADQYVHHIHICVGVYKVDWYILHICCLSGDTISYSSCPLTSVHIHSPTVHCFVVQLHSITPPLPHTGVTDRLHVARQEWRMPAVNTFSSILPKVFL